MFRAWMGGTLSFGSDTQCLLYAGCRLILRLTMKWAFAFSLFFRDLLTWLGWWERIQWVYSKALAVDGWGNTRGDLIDAGTWQVYKMARTGRRNMSMSMMGHFGGTGARPGSW